MSNIETLEQKRQEALDKAARLKIQIDKQLDGQKFVLGGMLMAIAEHEPDRIPQILSDIDKYVTRKADISRLEGLKRDLVSKTPNSFLKPPTALIERFEEYVTGINWSKKHTPSQPGYGEAVDDDIPF